MKSVFFGFQFFFFSLIVYSSYAQIDTNSFDEFTSLMNYEEIDFEWKMMGRVQLSLNEGINNLKENKLNLAIGNFDEILKSDSKFWIAIYYRGICYKLQHKFSEARLDFLELYSLRKDLPQPYLELGKIMILLSDWKEAERYLNKCIDKFPKNLNANCLMGDLFFLEGKADKAKPFYKSCKKIDASFTPSIVKLGLIELITTKNPEAALAYFDKAIAIDSTQRDALWYRAMVNYKTAPKKSLKDINTLLQHNPTNIIFLLQKGLILTELNDFEHAWSSIYKFIQLAQINENNVVGKQTSLDKRIDVQNLGYYLVRVVYGLSEENQTEIKKAYCLMFADRSSEALESLNQVKEIKETALVQYMRGVTCEHLKQHKEAWQCYERAIEQDPNIFDTHQKRGIYRTNIQQWPAAEEDFTEMIRINPQNKFGYKLRSVARYYQKDYQNALKDANKVLMIDSTDCEARQTRGHCLYAMGIILHGVEDFLHCDTSVLLKLDFNVIHTELKSLLLSGDTTKTLRHLTKLIEIQPLYEDGTKLKIEILTKQKKWSELNEFLKDRFQRFVYWNTSEYQKYIQKKLKEVERILGKESEKP